MEEGFKRNTLGASTTHPESEQPMKQRLLEEMQRLVESAGQRRADLLLSGLRRARTRKLMNIAAGVLALFSAGAIAGVIADVFGEKSIQILAAVSSAVSGSLSLVITAYYSDEEITNRLIGSSKYLALRDAVFRLATKPKMKTEERFESLAELQEQYARLDEMYSRYTALSYDSGGRTRRPFIAGRCDAAEFAEALRKQGVNESD
jgi:hypothetical protein